MSIGATGESYTGLAPRTGAAEFARFISNGAQTSYFLDWQPGSPAGILVYVGGVPQFAGSGYRLADNELIFDNPAPQGTIINVVGFTYGLVVSDVAAGSVGVEQLATDAFNRLGYQRLFFRIAELKFVLSPAVTPEVGWYVLDDRDYDSTIYWELLAACNGTQRAGSVQGTFKLPEAWGKAAVIAGEATAGARQRLANQPFGAEQAQLIEGNLPTHKHEVTQSTNVTAGGVLAAPPIIGPVYDLSPFNANEDTPNPVNQLSANLSTYFDTAEVGSDEPFDIAQPSYPFPVHIFAGV